MSSQPNILWLTLESVRADHTSLHGYRRDTTPNLREMSTAPDAEIIDPVISASMWTPASTASMLTGTHMSTHQLGRDGKCERKLSPSIETLPQRLSNIGYQTALFSPTHYISHETGLDRGFEHVESIYIRKSNFIGYDSTARDSIYCSLRCVLESRTSDISGIKKEISNSKNYLLERRFNRWFSNQVTEPFFAYIHIPSPHHPYYPVAKFRDEYISDIQTSERDAAGLSESVYTGTEGIRRRMAAGLDLSDAEWEAIEAMYDAEIRYADYTAKQLVSTAQLAADGPLVVIVTADHGDLFGEYGLIGHNLVLHDGLTRVPGLVIGIEDIVDPPKTVTQHIDLTYTVASAAGISLEQFQGRDLRDPSRPYAISQRGIAHLGEYTKYDDTFDSSRFFKEPVTSVRTTDWRYLENKNRQVLYDLPDEESNVANKYPDIVAELSKVIEDEDIDWTRNVEGGSVEFSEEARSRLNDLGYLT